MKVNKYIKGIIGIALVSLISAAGFAKPERVLRIYNKGGIIQEYNIKDIDYIQIDDVADIPTPEPGNTVNGHEYVDLGLPSGLKWATCNVGASSPTESGDYFAWGETMPKSSYTSDNCATWNKGIGQISGNANYDAARANWGGTWRMPSDVEMNELKNKCSWTWTSKSGINGYVVKGPNGNEIFMPAAGYRVGTALGSTGSNGDYWSSTPDGAQYAYGLGFNSGSRYMGSYYRYVGRSVRPVSD